MPIRTLILLRRTVLIALLMTFVRFASGAEGQQAGEESVFSVLEYQVEGNSVLPALSIERAVYPFLGERKSIKDVEAARLALEKTYHDAGYLTVLVDIPEQDVRGGIVMLKVTEAPVERLRVLGSRYYSLGRIRERAPELAEGGVPYFPGVQAQLGGLNRSADQRITPVLRPGKTPGTVDVDLNVEDKLPLHGGAELNNRYSANTEPLRLSGTVRYDNLWQLEHGASLYAQVSPQDTSQVRVLSGTYTLPFPESTKVLALYAVHSNSNVAAVGTLNVIGKGDIFGARAIMPLPGKPGFYQSATLGIDYKRFGEGINLVGGGNVNTPISYTPMVAQYSATDQLSASTTQYNASLNFALRGVMGNSDAEFANKRFGASANYVYLRADMQHQHDLVGDFKGFVRAEGQAASQPLIANEQYVAGGADNVRGYLEAERLGDEAARATVEVRAPFAKGLGERSYAFAFYDYAWLRVLEPLPGQTSRFTLSSAGAGLRFRPGKSLSVDLDWAKVLRDGAFTKEGDQRVLFRLAYDF